MADIITPPSETDARARAYVANIINATWNKGIELKDEFSAKMDVAQAGFLDETAAPHVAAGSVAIPSISAPLIDIPSTASTVDVIDVFDTKYLELVALLSDKFDSFKAEYFPDETNAYIAAEDWLQAAVNNPDSGLPPSVQAKIWGDDQARILADTVRASDAVIATFAGRRFPLPPDAAASAVLQIQQKAQDELAESSRKVAIMSVDMQKFSVTALLGLRASAMDACIKYITALASGPDMASKLVNVGYDAQSKLISAAADFYRADIQAADLTSKVAQYNNSLQLDAATKNQSADMTLIEDKLKALLAEAGAIAQTATALLNNVHAQVSIGASRNASVAYSYSNDTNAQAPTVNDVG